jgi:hypothetical protein
MRVLSGCTRHVLLIGKYAIKIPQLTYGWRLFLLGLLGNMQEASFSEIPDDRMAPVFFSISGGFLIVMPRCEPLTNDEYAMLNISMFWEIDNRSCNGYYGECRIPVENKQDSFGWYKGRIVAIDYGS